MCGIVGGKKLNENEIKKYWDKLAHRGTDSYGAILFNKDITTVKGLDKKELKLPQSNFTLAHNRAASVGGVNIDLAHPIVKNEVAIIHNGTKKSIKEVFSKDIKSDTQGILEFTLHLDNLNTIANILNGAGVVFIVNLKDGKILFHRDETRPLMINKDRTLIASEPIERGEWALIKKQDKLFNSFEEFLNSVEVYDWVNCDNIELMSPYNYTYSSTYNIYEKCINCKKVHYLYNNKQCPACRSNGLKVPKIQITTPTKKQENKIPINAIVHISNSPYLYRVISYEEDGLYNLIRMDNNKIIYYQHQKILKPANPKHLIINEYYYFADKDDNVKYKRKFMGKSNNHNYIYRVRNNNNSLIVYKYVLWEKNIKLKKLS